MLGENDVVVKAWNTVLFDKFVRFKPLMIRGLSVHSDAALKRHRCPPGSRVLDVGCGFGDSTQMIAAQVGPSGSAFGVDCAENFVEASRLDAAQAGVRNASFFVADVQAEDLRGPYDFVFSRFRHDVFNMPPAQRCATFVAHSSPEAN